MKYRTKPCLEARIKSIKKALIYQCDCFWLLGYFRDVFAVVSQISWRNCEWFQPSSKFPIIKLVLRGFSRESSSIGNQRFEFLALLWLGPKRSKCTDVYVLDLTTHPKGWTLILFSLFLLLEVHDFAWHLHLAPNCLSLHSGCMCQANTLNSIHVFSFVEKKSRKSFNMICPAPMLRLQLSRECQVSRHDARFQSMGWFLNNLRKSKQFCSFEHLPFRKHTSCQIA